MDHPLPAAMTTPSPALLAAEVPLVVDLDGTLLCSDTLLESLFAVARSRPLVLLKLPSWLLQGTAAGVVALESECHSANNAAAIRLKDLLQLKVALISHVLRMVTSLSSIKA